MATTTFHSFKGGTGKSLLAATLAYSLSREGKSILVIDGDYRAPCFEAFFPRENGTPPFTSFLKSECAFEDTISPTRFPNLSVCYAPTPSFGQEILQADVKTHGRYLKRIMESIRSAHEELGFDEIIIDNSSGISLQSINFLSCSNRSVMVIRPVRYGVETTYGLIEAIYRKLKYADPKRTRRDFLVWNQTPINDDSSVNARIQKYLEYWKQRFAEADIKYAAAIPYIPDVVAAMIVDSPLDLPKLTGLLQRHIDDIGRLMMSRE